MDEELDMPRPDDGPGLMVSFAQGLDEAKIKAIIAPYGCTLVVDLLSCWSVKTPVGKEAEVAQKLRTLPEVRSVGFNHVQSIIEP